MMYDERKHKQYQAVFTGGMACPTYYCSRNTQMPEEKPRNKNKVLQYSNTGLPGGIL